MEIKTRLEYNIANERIEKKKIMKKELIAAYYIAKWGMHGIEKPDVKNKESFALKIMDFKLYLETKNKDNVVFKKKIIEISEFLKNKTITQVRGIIKREI